MAALVEGIFIQQQSLLRNKRNVFLPYRLQTIYVLDVPLGSVHVDYHRRMVVYLDHN